MQFIWFLAPTVSLCEQQCEVIKLQNPAVIVKLLTGSENVDSWSETTWLKVLSDARIVVSTYQVLLDALDHAFVRMNDIALLVFDEGVCSFGRHRAKSFSPTY